jgi:hypothetical protein
VSFFTVTLIVRGSGGNLTCKLNGALNLCGSRQGEFCEICVSSGGAGMYAIATGHRRLYSVSATSQLVVPTGTGTGTIVTPCAP